MLYLVTWDGETQERVWFQTSPVSAVTRPTHFNFYHSGALVTYNDITPDLPQAELSDQSLCCLLIGHLARILASDWLLESLVSPWAPCHRVMVSSGSRVTNIKIVMLGLYSRQIYTTWSLYLVSLAIFVTTCSDDSLGQEMFPGPETLSRVSQSNVSSVTSPHHPEKCAKWFKIVTWSGTKMTHDNNVGTIRRVSIMISIYQISKNCCNLAFLQRRHGVISGLSQWLCVVLRDDQGDDFISIWSTWKSFVRFL